MSTVKFFAGCCGLLLAFAAGAHGGATPDRYTKKQALTVKEEPGRIVLAWTGPVAEPMRDQFVAAVDQYKADPRRIVIALNSPGGSVGHGREVVAAIREAKRAHAIDTLVAKGGVCASMCMPIYLLGRERAAAPDAHFMFHEASLDLAALPGLDPAAFNPESRKSVEKAATDAMFRDDLQAPRVDALWLSKLRSRIIGRDVWMSGRQLVAEGSGVVDALTD